MFRRLARLGFRFALVTVLGYAVARVLQRQRSQGLSPAPAPTWPPVTPPSRAEPAMGGSAAVTAPDTVAAPEPSLAAAAEPVPPQAWVAPYEGTCPATHPIKAKLSSKLFHLPGMFAYDRTKPDRCYASEAAAVADGLRKAKR